MKHCVYIHYAKKINKKKNYVQYLSFNDKNVQIILE